VRRRCALAILCLLVAASAAASLLPAESYETQHRESIEERPSRRFLLGTDKLGRDRLVRDMYATRVSLTLAAGAALTAILLGAAIGAAAGYFEGGLDRCVSAAIDLMLSLPWLFVLLAVRATLPLNASPAASLLVTYLLLAVLGWAAPARMIRAGVQSLKGSEFVLQARATGCGELRALRRHLLPNLRSLMLAQFCVCLPVFILAEANLGFLGLSAAEPYPTWGNLLAELQSPASLRPECFLPVVLIAATVLGVKALAPTGESNR
jgi:ABC-type dipeptide/oligopeptide/nickel transport system permease subunit